MLASHRPLLLTVCACASLVGPASADDERQSETVAELNAYFRLSDRFRLFAGCKHDPITDRRSE